MQYHVQAVDSVTGDLYQWLVGNTDSAWVGAGYPGPNSATEIAIISEYVPPDAGPEIGGRTVMRWQPAADVSTPTLLGFRNDISGTQIQRAPNTTNFAQSLRRVGYVSAASVGASCGTRYGAGVVWRGNASGRGGFDYDAVFFTPAIFSGSRLFVGLHSSTSEIPNVDPSTLTSIVGFGADDTDTNWNLMVNDGSGAATKTDIGASFPKESLTSVYRVRISCDPNGGEITATMMNLNNGAKFTATISVNIPALSTFLSTHIWANTGAGSSAVNIDVTQQTLVTDY